MEFEGILRGENGSLPGGFHVRDATQEALEQQRAQCAGREGDLRALLDFARQWKAAPTEHLTFGAYEPSKLKAWRSL